MPILKLKPGFCTRISILQFKLILTNTMNKNEKALQYFNNNFNCSQAVLAAFGQDFGISEDNCLKIACAFGAGMGRQQKTCGAVTGALMVLGLKYGKALKDEDLKKVNTYSKTTEFLNSFEKENSSTVCLELLDGLDMKTEEGMKKIKELNLFKIRCDKYVSDAVKITEKMLSE
jgi:C_GCAxxG_C_C family probable redox protein